MYQMNKWAIREYLGVLVLWLVAYFAYRWAGYDYLYSVIIAILPIIFGIFWVGQNLLEKLPWYHGMK